MNQEEINTLFIALIKDIDAMIEKDFYKEKQIIKEIKEKVQDWFNDFKISKTLNNITLENIKFIDEEITELIDKYIMIEPVEENHVERLSYDFGILERIWKDEMLGEMKNVW